MTRELTPRKHRLSFEVGEPKSLEFFTHETFAGVEVSYEEPQDGLSCSLEEFVQAWFSEQTLRWIIRDEVLSWVERMGIRLAALYVQFVPEATLGGGFGGRGICGKGRRALLQLEWAPTEQGAAFFIAREEPASIVPHELMHIQDALEGRSPTLYPFVQPLEGAWIDETLGLAEVREAGMRLNSCAS